MRPRRGGLVVIERQQKDGLNTIGLSTAGWPLQQGFNSSGVGFAIANLASTRTQPGCSYIAALPHIIGTSKAAVTASRAAEKMPLCSARYYLFVDRDGYERGVETTGVKAYSAVNPPAHTNHFIFSDMLKEEGRPKLRMASEARRQNAEDFCLGDATSLNDIFNTLARSFNFDEGIEQRGEHDEDRTCASFIIAPEQQRMWFTSGPPSQSPHCNITLSTAGEK